MTQTVKQRVTLREIMQELREIRAFLETPPKPAQPYTHLNTPWGKPYFELPTDVIAPVPPPVTTSGTALGKARSFLKRFLAGMRG